MRTPPDSGQASVEFVLLLPLVAVAFLGSMQAVLFAHAAWAAGQAAEAAARAGAVGADPRTAARSALPTHLERHLRLQDAGDGTAEVRVAVPRLVPALDLGHVAGRARFEPQR